MGLPEAANEIVFSLIWWAYFIVAIYVTWRVLYRKNALLALFVFTVGVFIMSVTARTPPPEEVSDMSPLVYVCTHPHDRYLVMAFLFALASATIVIEYVLRSAFNINSLRNKLSLLAAIVGALVLAEIFYVILAMFTIFTFGLVYL